MVLLKAEAHRRRSTCYFAFGLVAWSLFSVVLFFVVYDVDESPMMYFPRSSCGHLPEPDDLLQVLLWDVEHAVKFQDLPGNYSTSTINSLQKCLWIHDDNQSLLQLRNVHTVVFNDPRPHYLDVARWRDACKLRARLQVAMVTQEHSVLNPVIANDHLLGSLNVISTFHLWSDNPLPYGKAISSPSPVTIPTYLQSNASTNEPMSLVVSNCKARPRLQIVKKLIQAWPELKIASYGKCMRNTAWPNDADGKPLEKIEVISRHPFYLAMENAYVEDYATEKLADVLADGRTLPVYFGAKTSWMPKHSFVNFDDFHGDMYALGTHLKHLLSNKTAYQSYFTWRQSQTIVVPETYNWTSLCQRLFQERQTRDAILRQKAFHNQILHKYASS